MLGPVGIVVSKDNVFYRSTEDKICYKAYKTKPLSLNLERKSVLILIGFDSNVSQNNFFAFDLRLKMIGLFNYFQHFV